MAENGPVHPLVTDDVGRAAATLAAGGLVAFPTETVYGLGAAAVDPHAVALVYATKGRPADHPLIVHLGHASGLASWATAVPSYARALADACWPGPLTLVLPRSVRAGDHVTGGQGTVGLRVPDHPVALALLSAFEDGIAAPSANRFGQVSPTTAQHVLDGLGDWLVPGRDLVLDGGPAQVGVESTIVDATGPLPRLLRPGGIGAADVATITGLDVLGPRPPGDPAVRAPGSLASHYAPSARVVVLDGLDARGAFDDVSIQPQGRTGEGSSDAAPGAPPTMGLLALEAIPTPEGWVRLAAPVGQEDYARVLYASLREADALGLAIVVAVPPPDDGVGAAVRDRLRRASSPGASLP